VLLILFTYGQLREAAALPVQQVLSRPSSSITFGVDSDVPALQMKGDFSDFKGTLALDPHRLERSSVNLSLNLQSARLSPEQILQAVFLQTALTHVRPPTVAFKSSSITKSTHNTYLVTGTYTVMGRTQVATVPFQLVNLSALRTEIRLLLSGALKERDTPRELSAIAPGSAGSKGWAKATLVFVKTKS
jgi:polyisoprenoid-binding protein YceI